MSLVEKGKVSCRALWQTVHGAKTGVKLVCVMVNCETHV